MSRPESPFPSTPSDAQFKISSEDDADFDDEDTQSISLSTPPRSPLTDRPPRSSPPSSGILKGDPPDSGSSIAFVPEGEVLFTASDLTSPGTHVPHSSSSIAFQTLEISPIDRNAIPNGMVRPTLEPAFQLESPSTKPAVARESLSARMQSMLPGTPMSPSVATMPVVRARPASMALTYKKGNLILGVVVIDFNHLVGPQVEFTVPPAIGEDKELCNLLPFLALPDGAHLNSEDYSYFHIPTSYTGDFQTVFGISCNRQIPTSLLIHKAADVTRSTVQKAIVVLASKPIFGPIRDKLGVVTRAFFNQLDFQETGILVDFYSSLEQSLSGQLTESALYMGTSLRELVHKFRHKTLILLKLLMLQKKIMFFGQPVETLCTYQYSLVSLMPGLLNQLEDCASPSHDRREHDTERPLELRTSDRASLLKYLGLPLNVFGKDAFFQPYLPLQEVDMLKSAGSYLCGTTNNIVTQQRDAKPDLLVNIETTTFEFIDYRTEKIVQLTSADRKWMDEILRDVNETWNDADPTRPSGMQFKGSDDYLRAKFEDYICSALAGIKYADFLAKGVKGDVLNTGGVSAGNVLASFGEPWIAGFKQTRAGILWDRTTDSVLFDICEPRHPCEAPPSIASDIGVRLTEGLHELNLEERMAPAREALTSAFASGLRAVEGVRSELGARLAAQAKQAATPSTLGGAGEEEQGVDIPAEEGDTKQTPLQRPTGLRQLSLVGNVAAAGAEASKGVGAALGSWGSFFASKAASLAAHSPTLSPVATGKEKSTATGGGDVDGTNKLSPTASGLRGFWTSPDVKDGIVAQAQKERQQEKRGRGVGSRSPSMLSATTLSSEGKRGSSFSFLSAGSSASTDSEQPGLKENAIEEKEV